jgi:hypothetical protein
MSRQVDPGRLLAVGQDRINRTFVKQRVSQALHSLRPRLLTADEFRREYVDQFGWQLPPAPAVDVDAFYEWIRTVSPTPGDRVTVAQFILDLVQQHNRPGVALPGYSTHSEELRVAEVNDSGLHVLYRHTHSTRDIVILDVWRDDETTTGIGARRGFAGG